MINKIIYEYENLRIKYSNYEILKKVYVRLFEKIFHVFNESVVIKIKSEIKDGKFDKFIPNDLFFFNSKDKKKYNKFLEELDLDKNIIFQANKICDHKFNLLGSGEINLGRKINWHKDYKSDFCWPKLYYKKLKIVDLNNDSDVKFPWELSRFQHIPTLGQAYWLTNDEKFALEFKEEVEDWIKENPVYIGVNWTCTMDVCIRVINFIIGYFYFNNSAHIDEKFKKNLFKNLYVSGKFIKRNLECDVVGHGNNHYLTNLVGLIWLGLFMKDFDSEARKWLDEGLNRLLSEFEYQVNEEGTNFEASIPYHRLATELLLSTTILCEKNNIKFDSNYTFRLEKMCEFILNYTKNNGLAPQIGDADDGRLHIFSNYGQEEKRDHRHLMAVAGEYFNRDDFRECGKNYKSEALWLTGRAKNSLGLKSLKEVKTIGYPQMGYFIIKDNRVNILIRCGGVGQAGMGGHAHNDQLSVEIQIDGNDVFIDPGTFVYTANYKTRNLLRSTELHNTVSIEGLEQNHIEEKALFKLYDRSKAKCIKFEKEGEKTCFEGLHYGYQENLGVVHTRKIIYDPKNYKIEITDSISNNKGFKANWILGSDVKVEKFDETIIKTSDEVTIQCNNECFLEDVLVSPSYGVSLESKKIVNKAKQENYFEIKIPVRKEEC
ncbi:hypothetical protein PM10SUCC1_24300 [Propionigenium maris DSM 9537]|uniref:Heparin-sulfate lyase N-terminal domain-containing protein n=1 Tax=Propionigenium maris DSM 9537 TaxID=1123000 RepID=A0A9W6GNG5_9FUSO|nr:alginate lyase family protein [Propionigenium maris]GLI56916.1 hypothetical protein PM10SUCC1_24300 [Propionigenium maris DSM 9537]